MSNESTEPTLTDERLRELRDILHNGWERDGDTEDEMRDAIDELLRLRLRPAEREGGPRKHQNCKSCTCPEESSP